MNESEKAKALEVLYRQLDKALEENNGKMALETAIKIMELEGIAWTLVSPAYPSSSSALLSTAASAWQSGRGGYGRNNLYLLGGETRGNDRMADRDWVGVGAGGDWDF